MHHFIYPSKDTYITNRTNSDTKNFGVDELLQVGTSNIPIRFLSPTRDYVYTNLIFNHQNVTSFTGIFSGSFGGTASDSSGSISGSNLLFSASYFSGNVNGSPVTTSGSVSGSLVNGSISGSIISPYVIGIFIGQLTGSSGCLTGTGSGIDTRVEPNWTTTNTQYVDRALLQFDLTTISQSIANGDIVSASFFLKVKVCNEFELPITYTIYALPISQSWNMGNGYFSDGGSDEGVSWRYRDNNHGTPWYTSSLTGPRVSLDFINHPSLLTASFGYGGGTWYTGSYCSQSFQYQTSDIDMDLTPMVMNWLNGSIPNRGVMLIQSDELIATGSGFTLKFFSRDTNTIYSPYLDVAWDDSVFSTGSVFTASSQTITVPGAISASVQSGSSFSIKGGVNGGFSGSAFITLTPHYITASNFNFTNVPVQQFTGSFSGSFYVTAENVNGSISGSNLIFSASFFTGSIDGVNTETSGSVSGSLITGSISGSVVSFNPLGFFIGQITSSTIYLNGISLTGSYFDPLNENFSGFLSCIGTGGNILGDPVFGTVHGLMTTSSVIFLPGTVQSITATEPNLWPFVTGYNIPNSTSPFNPLINSFFVFIGPDSWWAGTLPILPSFPITTSCGPTFTVRTMAGIFETGPFSGSTFSSYYYNYGILFGTITGSWNVEDLLGANVYIPLPSGIEPSAYAFVNGVYFNGTALGLYTLSGSTSASFNGQFINGDLVGGYLVLQLSGSAYSSSFSYVTTTMTSSMFVPLDITRPFSINLQNLQPQYKAGDIVRLDVFGRKKFPLKFFGITTQQTQYLVPEYLPVSSSYALKDNQTDEIVVNFDNYTRISCEYPNGNYFLVDTTGLPQERYYTVLIRVQNGTETYTIDTGKTFKITR